MKEIRYFSCFCYTVVIYGPKRCQTEYYLFFYRKIPNERELKQISINHSSDISTKDFINIYRKCTAGPYSCLVNDITLSSDNPLRLAYIIKIMTTNDQIRDEKLQYDINREANKISA